MYSSKKKKKKKTPTKLIPWSYAILPTVLLQVRFLRLQVKDLKNYLIGRINNLTDHPTRLIDDERLTKRACVLLVVLRPVERGFRKTMCELLINTPGIGPFNRKRGSIDPPSRNPIPGPKAASA